MTGGGVAIVRLSYGITYSSRARIENMDQAWYYPTIHDWSSTHLS